MVLSSDQWPVTDSCNKYWCFLYTLIHATVRVKGWGSLSPTWQFHNSANSTVGCCFMLLCCKHDKSPTHYANCPLSSEYKYLLWSNCHPKEMHKFTKVSCNNMLTGWTLFIKNKFTKYYPSPGKKLESPRDLVDWSKLFIQCVWFWSTPPQRLIETEVKWTFSSHLHSHSSNLKWQLNHAQWEQPRRKNRSLKHFLQTNVASLSFHPGIKNLTSGNERFKLWTVL